MIAKQTHEQREASSVQLSVFHGLLTTGLDGSIRSTVRKYSAIMATCISLK